MPMALALPTPDRVVNHGTDHRAQARRPPSDRAVKTTSYDHILYVSAHPGVSQPLTRPRGARVRGRSGGRVVGTRPPGGAARLGIAILRGAAARQGLRGRRPAENLDSG